MTTVLNFLIIIIILFSAFWVYYDATKNNIGSVKSHSSMSAGAWYFCCLGLWIIAFPMYLLKRSNLIKIAQNQPVEAKWKKIKLVVIFFGSICIALFLVALHYINSNEQHANSYSSVNDEVVSQAIAQYDIVKRNGTPADRCVHAGMVFAAIVQATDENRLQKWKKIRSDECTAAGLPQLGMIEAVPSQTNNSQPSDKNANGVSETPQDISDARAVMRDCVEKMTAEFERTYESKVKNPSLEQIAAERAEIMSALVEYEKKAVKVCSDRMSGGNIKAMQAGNQKPPTVGSESITANNSRPSNPDEVASIARIATIESRKLGKDLCDSISESNAKVISTGYMRDGGEGFNGRALTAAIIDVRTVCINQDAGTKRELKYLFVGAFDKEFNVFRGTAWSASVGDTPSPRQKTFDEHIAQYYKREN